MASFSEEELADMLECARYGEIDELKAYIRRGMDVNHRDGHGNTALHKAAANGHADVVEYLLKEANAAHLANEAGNMPLHWAAQNKHHTVVRLLTTYVTDLDVLALNEFGRGALSEGFSGGDPETVKALLQHKSAADLEKTITQQATDDTIAEADEDPQAPSQGRAAQDVTYRIRLGRGDDGRVLSLREVGLGCVQTFDTDSGADTTGVCLWGSGVILAQWVADLGKQGFFGGKRVLVLGAGCGLEGLACAHYSTPPPSSVLLTDSLQAATENLQHNVQMNQHESVEMSVARLDWGDSATWPQGDTASFDVILGADLVYHDKAGGRLAVAVSRLLARPQGVFLCASRSDREGADTFTAQMERLGLVSEAVSIPPEYRENPLVDPSEDESAVFLAEKVESDGSVDDPYRHVVLHKYTWAS
mmetsp:Transcript_55/g.204  ORF Transcript_55/g.204 Transcript_55/m.204 type:complete len:419 (-) Transcript_55:186-1442(-)